MTVSSRQCTLTRHPAGHCVTTRARYVNNLLHCPNQPPPTSTNTAPPPLAQFIANRTRLTPSVTFAALYLLQRLKTRFIAARGSSGHRLFISVDFFSSLRPPQILMVHQGDTGSFRDYPGRSTSGSPTGSIRTIGSITSLQSSAVSTATGFALTTFVPPLDTIPDLSDFQSSSNSSLSHTPSHTHYR